MATAVLDCSGAETSSFSHGFLRFGCVLSDDCPSRTVFGTCLMPGIGLPEEMSSTTSANDGGY